MSADTSEQPDAVTTPTDPSRIGYGVYARPRRSRWRRGLFVLIILVVVGAAVVGTRVASGWSGADALLAVRVENQQPISVDLRMSVARSPYVFGVNVFPEEGTQAVDGAYGFMRYGPRTVDGIKSAGITMLRFPGGAWGEEHTLSYTQINAFLRLAQQTHTTPLMQVRLSGGTARQAAALVSYCNNPHDPARQQHPGAPFVPVHYWVIGNEPDLIGSSYTVADYVRDYIAFATAMKAVDPAIQIFGPEISQYNGPDAPPLDAQGTPWLMGFLQGIAAYEHAHHTQILDGVSIHRYPFVTSIDSSSLLFASADEWDYLLPLLRKQVQQIMGADLPIAVTEINTSAVGAATASPLATALWWSDTLGTLLEERVNDVDFFAARGLEHPYSLLTAEGHATPLYRAMQLYTHMAPDVIAVGSAGNPVSVYAATNGTHDMITLMLVNKSPGEAAVSMGPTQPLSAWQSRQFSLPPYAMACVVLRRDGNDQLFLYAPSAQTLAAGSPGTIVEHPLH